MLDLSLINGPIPAAVTVVAAAGLVLLALGVRPFRIVLFAVLAATAFAALVGLVVNVVWRPFPEPLSLEVLVCLGAVVLALVLAVARRRGRRLLTVLAVVVVLVGALSGVNTFYGQYPTMRAVLGPLLAETVALDEAARPAAELAVPDGSVLADVWRPSTVPDKGTVSSASIPASTDYRPRDAWVYLPPAYAVSPRPRLPVVVLLAGQPGTPRDWLDAGRLTTQEDASARARDLVLLHGGTSLSYMTTWRGNRYWFTPDGRAVVAYRVVATIALTVGDPIGPPQARRAAVRGFASFCAHEGWTPCLYSISEELRDEVASSGWHAVQVAEDTVVPLRDLAFTGRKWQDVRTALNKAGKRGITAEWVRYADAPPALTDQVRSISAEWVADKGLPEMAFTLGGLAELSGDGVRCLVAVDADRTVHAVTSWLPVHVDGRVVGWTLDFMRRRGSAFPGAMEFLIASAALALREEGSSFLSLSGAPLARLDRGARPCAVQRVLDFTGRVLEPVYGFRSLLAFKAKFQPVYRPLYMAYPDPAALPRIAGAVGRAYLPGMSVRQGVRLAGRVLRSVRREPVQPVA
ncbi:hypothetical protein SUDANB95_04281 [Actinosynnema sp. ALI-1.44]